jgi:hypothetical protein
MALRLSHGGEKRHAKDGGYGGWEEKDASPASVVSMVDVCWVQCTLIKYGEETPAALITGGEALEKGELQHQGGDTR